MPPSGVGRSLVHPPTCGNFCCFCHAAVFLGVNTAEVVGDYTAGPSHVLPTSGTARFSSPLGVYDFQVRSSVIECSESGSVELNRVAAIIADAEGLLAHAESARSRAKG